MKRYLTSVLAGTAALAMCSCSPSSWSGDSLRAAAAKSKAAEKACEEKRVAGEIKTFVAAALCANPATVAAYHDANYADMDLIYVWVSARLTSSAKIDKGDATPDTVEAQLVELRARMTAEAQNRQTNPEKPDATTLRTKLLDGLATLSATSSPGSPVVADATTVADPPGAAAPDIVADKAAQPPVDVAALAAIAPTAPPVTAPPPAPPAPTTADKSTDSVAATASAPVTESPAAASSAAPATAYRVQFGVFARKSNAERLRRSVRSKELKPAIVTGHDRHGHPLYYVRSVDFADAATAEAAAREANPHTRKGAVKYVILHRYASATVTP